MRVILSTKIKHEFHFTFCPNEFYILPHFGIKESRNKKRNGYYLKFLSFALVLVIIN